MSQPGKMFIFATTVSERSVRHVVFRIPNQPVGPNILKAAINTCYQGVGAVRANVHNNPLLGYVTAEEAEAGKRINIDEFLGMLDSKKFRAPPSE
jgi:hypothetical protein